MPENVTPQKMQLSVRRGFDRIKQYRLARAMFIKEYVGQYYKNHRGLTGDQPINLIFSTIRTLVPNLVMAYPVNELTTNYTKQKAYGELLGLGIDQVQKDIKFKDTLRGWIVSALFAWGILKTGIAVSGEMLQFGDVNIDPGQVYTELVDLDDFVIDPICTDVKKAAFMGNRTRVPRQVLLDTNGYDHDLVNKLPKATFNVGGQTNVVENISKDSMSSIEMFSLQDYVNVVELWVPEADALVTIPDPMQITFDKYIRLTDYYGPKEGPYTFLSFTPPVPNNPFPVAPVSLWYDIHRAANRMFKKIMDQGDRQRDILVYNPAQADEAQDILESRDGDSVASQDPKGINVISYGGQNRNNEVMLQELQVWYNYIAGNPDQMAGNMTRGTKGSKETATRSQILQGNANISMEDARDILYDKTAEVSQKVGWYLHTDPLINLPVTKRKTGGEQIQLWLTPEQRQGDFLKFIFRIRAKSMSRMDPTIKSKRIVEFGTNLVPALMNAAMVAMQMGVRFNIQRAITD
ncbi:MAG TPA: hypothetical protein ENH82_01650, partial [bacterium]|nr:hypothetical protein [bacterium]